MKILCCGKCNQLFNLSFEYQECHGGHGGGQYIDHVNAKIWGDPTQIFILGFANTSFINALRDQINLGDRTDSFNYGGTIATKGREFTAFVIPDSADSITRVPDKFDPIYTGLKL